jgi:hypothetical protein
VHILQQLVEVSRELTNALPESIYTSSLSKGGFKLPPLLNVLVTTALDAPPYTVQYKSVLLLPLFFQLLTFLFPVFSSRLALVKIRLHNILFNCMGELDGFEFLFKVVDDVLHNSPSVTFCLFSPIISGLLPIRNASFSCEDGLQSIYLPLSACTGYVSSPTP